MKQLLVYGVVLLLLTGFEAPAQCNADYLSTQCIPKLASGFNFVKSYNVEKADKEYVEYSYVFTKGTQYMINVCAPDQDPDGIVVTLYDSKRNKVATNKVGDQYTTAIAYPCNNTGIYYIQYTFDGESDICGGSALGFKR